MLRLFDDPLHLIILLVVILIVFGAGKLPSVGSALGTSIKEFKKATATDETETPPAAPVALSGELCSACQAPLPAGAQFCANCGAAATPRVSAAREVSCANCGGQNPAGSRFCAKCGTGLNVRAV